MLQSEDFLFDEDDLDLQDTDAENPDAEEPHADLSDENIGPLKPR
jgi:hypothetical protein